MKYTNYVTKHLYQKFCFLTGSHGNFKNLRGLDDNATETILEQVANKELSIAEMMIECKEMKKLKEIQEAFITQTGVASWEEAEERFHAGIYYVKGTGPV